MAPRVARSSSSASELARLIASSASSAWSGRAGRQVQRDVGLHLDRGQPVPDDVVHLLGQPQPLGVDQSPVGLGPLPGRASATTRRAAPTVNGIATHAEPGPRPAKPSSAASLVNRCTTNAAAATATSRRPAQRPVPRHRVDGEGEAKMIGP